MNQDDIKRYRRRSNTSIAVSIGICFLGVTLGGKDSDNNFAILSFMVGFPLFIFGCSNYAMSKGRHWIWGFLGFFTLFGLLVLIILPKNKRVIRDEPAQSHPPAPPIQKSPTKFFLHIGNEVKGPFTMEQIRGIVNVGAASLDSQCCKEGTEDWRTISDFISTPAPNPPLPPPRLATIEPSAPDSILRQMRSTPQSSVTTVRCPDCGTFGSHTIECWRRQ